MNLRCECRGLGPAVAVVEDRGHFLDCPQVIHPGNLAISQVMAFLLERGYVIIAPNIIAPNGELVELRADVS